MNISTGIIYKMINVKNTHIDRVESFTRIVEEYGKEYERDVIIVHARPYIRSQCMCPVCGKKCVKNGWKYENESYWRAPNFNGVPIYIAYRPQRILCPEHGALNEAIPWADGESRFLEAFNDEIAWLVCQISKTAICKFEGINWRTVGNCVKAAQDRLEPDIAARLHDNVQKICVDETSYKKGYKYITVVYDMEKNRVIWVHEDHGREVFSEFCKQLTEEERENITIVAGDGASWIDSCCKEFFPNATRCVDFFHVVQWANKALDEVRIGTASKAKKEYSRLEKEYKDAESLAAQAEREAKEEYMAAHEELSKMPNIGRPSKRKLELKTFIEKYEELHADGGMSEKAGPSKNTKLSPEHEASLKALSDKRDVLKGAKFALGHDPINCTDNQKDKLRLIQNEFPDLYRAYQLKESLRIILHMSDKNLATVELDKWINDAKNSGLRPMAELAEKIEKRHRENILNAIALRANSSKSEATNKTIKKLIFTAMGFRNMQNMISLIYLKCSGYEIPLHNRIVPSREYIEWKRRREKELRNKRAERRREKLAEKV